ncbi:MAG: hypothetical protein FJX47_11555 [Alphaproteobacteria bacterium]|nr:hypothetical protein [Alphaproteobacteria bacterium]
MFKKFEVALHNKEVKRLVKEGEKHKFLADEWADTHFIEVTAPDEAEARKKITRRYPPEQGFIVEMVRAL